LKRLKQRGRRKRLGRQRRHALSSYAMLLPQQKEPRTKEEEEEELSVPVLLQLWHLKQQLLVEPMVGEQLGGQ
jgi:hypothetical protein